MKKKIVSIVSAIVLVLACFGITACSSNEKETKQTSIIANSTGTRTVTYSYGDDQDVFSIDIAEEFGNEKTDDELTFYYIYNDGDLEDMLSFQHNSEPLEITQEYLNGFMEGIEESQGVDPGTFTGFLSNRGNQDGFEIQWIAEQEGTKLYVNSFYFNYGVSAYGISLGCSEKQDAEWEKMISTLRMKDASDENESEVEVESEQETEDPTADFTMEQENCYRQAKSYLESSPYSRQGLIDQLSSEYGSNYPKDVAEFAVKKLEEFGEVDWYKEAEEQARSYLESSAYSKQELIEQLCSEYGSQFTRDQAEKAVEKVYQ